MLDLESLLLEMLDKSKDKEIEVSSYVVEETYKNPVSFLIFCRKNNLKVTNSGVMRNFVLQKIKN